MGSSGDFDEFFRRELTPLVAFVRRAGFGAQQAEDAAQEAMAGAYQRWDALRSPRAWVRVVACRTAVVDARRWRDGVLRAVAAGWVVSVHHDPDVVVLAEERRRLLAVLGSLPECRRSAMAWHLDGYDHGEIAERLGTSPATVRSHLRHARDALRPLFAPQR
ncbi:MAG: sigma-70 family RNA polymerase sigma factor [Saccharothrix sp.]|nr:sigma-70 family RNA polymerase sigma factor [Saccharothrix sp.]